MKKIIIFALSAFLLLGSGIAIGSSINGDYKGNPIVKVTLQGKEIPAQDVPAMIVDGRTLVPLYYLQSMGYDLSWDASNYSVDVKPPKKKLSASEISKLTNRVGTITTYDQNNQPLKQGSGFIIDKGLLVTNNHVINNSSYIIANINNSNYKINNYVVSEPTKDISAAYIGNDKSPALNVSTELPKIGDKVYAIGSPDGHANTVSEGVVTDVRPVNGWTMILNTAYIEHGSSGGVLLNEYGEAVGITSSALTEKSIYLAIPMSYVQDELIKKK